MFKASLRIAETFISNPWVDLAIACVLVVVAWKMNQVWANLLLIFAWGLFVFSAFRTEPLSHQELLVRILWTMVVAGVFGLILYYLLWTTKNPATAANVPVPLQITSYVATPDPYPENTDSFAIKWTPMDSDVRLNVIQQRKRRSSESRFCSFA